MRTTTNCMFSSTLFLGNGSPQIGQDSTSIIFQFSLHPSSHGRNVNIRLVITRCIWAICPQVCLLTQKKSNSPLFLYSPLQSREAQGRWFSDPTQCVCLSTRGETLRGCWWKRSSEFPEHQPPTSPESNARITPTWSWPIPNSREGDSLGRGFKGD